MPITIAKESFFRPGFSFKYITGWDNLFKRDKYSGNLLFYESDPKYIVDVELMVDKNKLREEDIIVTLGDNHNAKNIEDIIHKNTAIIFEMCRSAYQMGFILDLAKMKIVETEDFTGNFPRFGLNTFFMFQNIPYQVFCLVNPTRETKDEEFYSWFVSYIYSKLFCLTPRSKIENYSKMFLQAITTLASSGGKHSTLSKRETVLNCELGDLDEYLIPVPGNKTKRFEHLVESSLEQMSKKSRKGRNK